MTGTSCQACLCKIALLPSTLGPKGDPMGSCTNCHSFTCGHHGQRDPNKAEFWCVECDQTLLAASSVASTVGTTVGAGGAHTGTVTDALSTPYFAANQPETWQVSSLDEFVQRRPRYADLFQRMQFGRGDTFELARSLLVRAGAEPARKNAELLAAAGWLAQFLYADTEEASPPDYLRPFWSGSR
jgi:hypothetical protein